jgi:hypothetical protein
MGTSSAQRSPATPEWERVRELYREGKASPGEVASRVASALDARTREEMAGPGVASCLSSLLRGSRQVATGGLEAIWQSQPTAQGPPVLRLAQALRQEAEQRIASRGLASRLADVALNALGTSALEAAAGGAPGVLGLGEPETASNFAAYARESRLGELSLCFLSHDFDHLFRYFVSRDLSDFIGSPALPTVAHGSRLRDAVALHCRQLVRQVPVTALAPLLERAVAGNADETQEQLQQVLQELTTEGLRQLTAAGG